MSTEHVASPLERLPFREDYESVKEYYSSISQTVSTELDLEHFDASLLKTAVVPNPDFAPGNPFFDRIISTLGNSNSSEEDLFDLGIDIGGYVESHASNPRRIITGYLNACAEIDAIKCGVLGKGGPTKLSNQVINYMRKQLAPVLAQSPKLVQTHNLINDSLYKSAETSEIYEVRNMAQWLYLKELTLGQEAMAIRNVGAYTESLYEKRGIDIAGNYETNEVVNESRKLTETAMEQRVYGLKPAVISAVMGGSWIFYDGVDYMNKITGGSPNSSRSDIAAMVVHVPNGSFSNLKMSYEDISFGPSQTGMIKIGNGDVQQDLTLYIGFDGHVTIDREGIHPIETIMSSHSKVAQALIAELSAHFFDLSMPVEREPRSNHSKKKGPLTTKVNNFDPILDLVVPRLKRIKNPTESVENDVVRSVREHDVVWHIRRLPIGWSPSPEALENARRNGVKLSENETFVIAHKRGNGNAVLGHQIVKRTIVTD